MKRTRSVTKRKRSSISGDDVRKVLFSAEGIQQIVVGGSECHCRREDRTIPKPYVTPPSNLSDMLKLLYYDFSKCKRLVFLNGNSAVTS